MFFLYANDDNIEKWVIFRQKYRKFALILLLYGYILKGIIIKRIGEPLYTNDCI